MTAAHQSLAQDAPERFEQIFQPAAPVAYTYSFNEPVGDDSRDADFASFRAATSLLSYFHHDISGMSMEEAVAATRSDLERREGRNRALTEQALALMLLDRHLADGALASTSPARLALNEPAPDDQIVIGLAMELLIENANPNADLISAGLTTLKGHWTPERISAAATTAAREAERQIALGDECPGCRPTPSTLARAEAIEAGIRGLDRLAME